MIPSAARALVGGWATAGRALVAPYLSAIYAVLAVAVLAGAAWGAWRVASWRAGYLEREAAVVALAAERDCRKGTACAAREAGYRADGAAAVAEARQAAQEAAQAEQARIAAEGRAAVERAEAAAARATADRLKAEARLRESIATSPTCAAQAREPIQCDY